MAPLSRLPLSRLLIGPALLMALPLIAVGVLALHALEADYALLRTRQDDAALSTLRGLGEAARVAVERTADEAAGRATALADRTEALRAFVLGGAVELVTLHRGGRRVFPPEDTATLLVAEREKLSAAYGALATAQSGLATAPRSWVWVAEADGGALLHCRNTDESASLCVLLGAARLRAALAEALRTARPAGAGGALALADPSGGRVWSRGASGAQPPAAVLPLDGPLRGWRAEAVPDADAAIGHPPALTLAAVVLPLLGSWLLLAWHVQRSQRAKLADSRHRAEIAAQLSHELRTPLANLRLYAGLIHRRADDAQAVRAYCAVIDSEADRLSRLADNAVAFARGEAPEGSGRGAAVPDAVVRDTVERLRPLCALAGCPVTVTGGAPAVRRFDVAALEQILGNLIDNARKYAPGGPIDVTTWIEGGGTDGGNGAERLFLAVRDHGPGVPPRQRERIFEAMVRHGMAGGGTGGFGLGLAAVRRLARANGGGARVEDAAPGARFVAWIGICPADTGAPGMEGTECAS